MIASINVSRLSWREFKALPEYSLSNPTGVVVGKRWRRNQALTSRALLCKNRIECVGGVAFLGSKCDVCIRQRPRWWMGEYVLMESGVTIRWSRIIVVAGRQ